MNLNNGNNRNIYETFSFGKTEYQRNKDIQSNRVHTMNTMNAYSKSVKENDDLKHAIQNEYKSNVILKKQKKETTFNRQKLNDISNDIDTVKRQVEISENETLRKNNFIFQLKIIFIFLLFSTIPAYLMKSNKLTQTQGIVVIGSMCLILVFILLKNFINHRYSNPNDYNVQLWNKPDIQEVVRRETQALNNAQSLQDKLNNMPPLEKLEFLLTEKKNTAIENEQYTLAGIYNTQLKQITNALASGDPYGGLGSSDQDVLQAIDRLNSEEHQREAQRIQELDNQVKAIQQNIDAQKSQIQNRLVQQEQNEDSISTLQSQITKLQQQIVFEENQLAEINNEKSQFSKSRSDKDMLDDLKQFKAIGQ